jgi:DNA-binding LacI/PurR family transcriptional regulator
MNGANSFPIGPQNTDGMIIFADCASDNDLKYFYFNRYPVVLICRTARPEINMPSVGVENFNASLNIVRHLIEIHNRRKIVFLRGLATHEDSLTASWAINPPFLKKYPLQSALVADGNFERSALTNPLKRSSTRKFRSMPFLPATMNRHRSHGSAGG